MDYLFKIHPSDNVAVALSDLVAGQQVTLGEEVITLQQAIPQAHKVALKTFAENELVMKYGAPIGHTTCPVSVGNTYHRITSKQT
ncbi:UxaA family hydrolase [Vibrio sp. PP-XX7]